jgi:TonB-dependent receptor
MYMKVTVKSVAIVLLCSLSFAIQARAEDGKAIEIPAGDLIQALKTLARQSGIDLVYRTDQLEGFRTPGINGTYSSTEAVLKLLEGTPLVIKTDASGAILITRPTANLPTPTASSLSTPQSAADAAAAGMLPMRNAQAEESQGGGKVAAAGGAPGSLRGRVSVSRTGATLSGARVRIIETGESATSDGNGNFRFANLAPGAYTLSISHIGFAEHRQGIEVEADEETVSRLLLGTAAWELEEITVFGTRSERAKALSQQRAAENSTFTVTTDTLGNFSGTTISEALRRVPGVAFQRDERTGDGTNIILRGLAPDMNAIQLNGLNLPVADGTSRSASLNNLLADSVDRITVHHSLLPSMNSAGSGGLVEIETKSPLQRGRRYFNFGVEAGRTADRDFENDFLGTGTVSGTFGEQETFGLSAALQYRKRKVQTISYNTNLAFGQSLPLERDGSLGIFSPEEVDPRVLFPFEPGIDQAFPQGFSNAFVDSDIETLAATFSSEWQISEHTALRLDVQRSQSEIDTFSRSSQLNMPLGYTEMPVVALDDEIRPALAWDGQASMFGYYESGSSKDVTDTLSLRGNTTHGRWEHHLTLGLAKGTSDKPQNYALNTSYRTLLGVQIDPSFIRDEAIDPVEGRVISPYGRRFGPGMQLPLLTRAGFDFFNDPANHELSDVQIYDTTGENQRYSADWGTRYSFGGARLKYIEVGANYESRRFASRHLTDTVRLGLSVCDEVEDPFCFSPTFTPVKVGDMGLGFDPIDMGVIGVPDGGFEVISAPDVARFLRGVRTLARTDPRAQLTPDPRDPQLLRASTKEADLAGYLQARVDLGRLEIIGGARLNRVEIDAFNLTSPGVILPDGAEDAAFAARFTRLVNESSSTTDILPRVALNFRQSEQLVFRSSYFLAVARPAVRDLSQDSIVSLNLMPINGPLADQESLYIMKGNPGLEPAVTHNFDLGVEYYSNQIGLMRFNAFYKLIDNLLEANVQQGVQLDLNELNLPDDPHFNDLLADSQRVENLFVTVMQPVNNPESARIWGVEGHLERQFTSLPGLWGGFGVYGNLTYTESSKRYTHDWYSSPIFENGVFTGGRQLETIILPSIAFEQQPKYSGTLALTYNKYDIDAALSYTDQARRNGGFATNGLSAYQEQTKSLDLRIAKRLLLGGGEYRVYFEGTDLLKGAADPDLLDGYGGERGVPIYYSNGVYLGGRQFKLGVSASF